MSSFENVEIFEDTKNLCEKNGRIKDSLAKSVKNQKLILEGEDLPVVDKSRFTDNAKVTVSTKRTFEAASGYVGQKVAVFLFFRCKKLLPVPGLWPAPALPPSLCLRTSVHPSHSPVSGFPFRPRGGFP